MKKLIILAMVLFIAVSYTYAIQKNKLFEIKKDKGKSNHLYYDINPTALYIELN